MGRIGLAIVLMWLSGCASMAYLATDTVPVEQRASAARTLVQQASDLRATSACDIEVVDVTERVPRRHTVRRQHWTVDRCGQRENYVVIDEARSEGQVRLLVIEAQ